MAYYMDASESAYWDQYDGDSVEYVSQATVPTVERRADVVSKSNAAAPSLMQYRQSQYLSQASECPSSRDSYWSRYIGNSVTNDDDDQCTPTSEVATTRPYTSDMRRMLVMPEKLAALHISRIDDGKPGNGQSLKRKTDEKEEDEESAATAADRFTKSTAYDEIISKTPGDRSSAQMYAGVNPIALITRLRFLQGEIEQNERLLLA
ncbi:hypothetical protein GGI15_000255 [Coemansia interrupta]|uniref:Uncharacterized protein n=1 Tax=Coemansia interrupta TaxID=1126814 RepID=A0A9W8HLJ5_9FUNG|nr:hypothetical protein GGI15_000255 [Coemansia interrupta]